MHLSLSAIARPALILVAATAMLGAAACAEDEPDAETDPTTEATTATTAESTATTAATATEAATSEATSEATGEASGEIVEVTAVDYAFEGLPETIEAGTTLAMTNESEEEFHELVAIQIPDDETRSVEELIQLPQEEIDAIFGEAPPATVLVAMPGEEAMPVLGDGTITETGRYAIVCFIPVGADPEAVATAMQATGDEAPDLGAGPPHAAEGMYAELTVE